MDIAFLGGVFEKEKIQDYMDNSKVGFQFAADALQWNIIEGLDYWNEKPVKIFNAPFIGSYPHYYREIMFQQSNWSHVIGAKDVNVGFLNIMGIKHLFRAYGMEKSISDWATDGTQKKVIVAYSAHMPFLWALRKAKVLSPNIVTCLVVPDLPSYMGLASEVSWFYKIAKKLDNIMIMHLLKHVDTFVLLTQAMAAELNVGKRNYCVVEGMVNQNDAIAQSEELGAETNKKCILYTGMLNYKYGIGVLLEAFKKIDDDSYELWICGFGEAEKDIVEFSKIDARIKWLGTVSRSQALSLQRKATVLINPRSANEEFTKYSFPSKNLEYLLSGRPVIAYKLPGIPADYTDYMFWVDGNTPIALARKIVEVCNLSRKAQDEFGEDARKFVLQNKNNMRQTKKIIDCISCFLKNVEAE